MLLFAVIFSLITAISEVDIIVPSFPEIQSLYRLSPFMVELVLGLNLLAHCIAALFAANIGDRFGRKKTIISGFILFAAGGFIGALVDNFYIILASRVIQGVGVAPAIVLSYIIAMERYPVSEQGRIMGLLNGTIALTLSIAPVLGSFLSLHYGYQGNFWLMVTTGIIAIATIYIGIPSDNTGDSGIKLGLSQYTPVLKSINTMIYIVFVSMLIATYYTFVGLASLFFIQGLGMGLRDFGYYMAALTLTFGIYSIFSGKIIKLLGKFNAFLMSIVFIGLFIISSTLVIIFDLASPLFILACVLLFVVGMVVPVNEGYVMALESFPDGKARASALIGTLKWIFTVAGVQTASIFFNGNFKAIGVTLTVMLSLSISLMFMAYAKDSRFRNLLNSKSSNK
ncbi:multidrug effflux MFS transporter [Enterobacter asburiae]|uniref:MFS transporter n=1 Tax=Enterobacter asburiae TaxID=61645 RepID=UPI0034E8CAF3|nr:MFS transporter [Enterobacter asburiae]